MPQDDPPTQTTTDADASLDLPAEMFRSGANVEAAIVGMYRVKHGPSFVDAKFTDVDGLALFEGDIVLGTADEARGLAPVPKGLGIPGPEFRWPDGVVPYVTTEELRPKVEAAIAHWQERTPFRFVERTDEEDYISFENQGGCWSRVGRQGGKQEISLGAQCTLGSAIHEIGHALGLWHEQSRADRDQHVEIVEENIDPEQLHNFDQHILDGDDLGPYDYGSIMHYAATAFSINRQPTIRAKGGQPIGQRNGLSAGDVAAIRLMYPDLEWPQADAATSPAATDAPP